MTRQIAASSRPAVAESAGARGDANIAERDRLQLVRYLVFTCDNRLPQRGDRLRRHPMNVAGRLVESVLENQVVAPGELAEVPLSGKLMHSDRLVGELREFRPKRVDLRREPIFVELEP